MAGSHEPACADAQIIKRLTGSNDESSDSINSVSECDRDLSDSLGGSLTVIELKSLILAQIERWRHALHMQVERQHGGNPGGEWRTGE
jgi:hypothetical protein